MILEYILLAVLLVAALFIVVAVTMQKTSDEGLSGTIAGGSDTYYKNDKSLKSGKMLKKWTIIIGLVFIVAVIAVYVMQPDYTTMIAAPGDWKNLGEFSSIFQ